MGFGTGLNIQVDHLQRGMASPEIHYTLASTTTLLMFSQYVTIFISLAQYKSFSMKNKISVMEKAKPNTKILKVGLKQSKFQFEPATPSLTP